MVLPGELDEVAGVPEEFEAQRAIERDRPLNVANDDLANELFGRVDVSASSSCHLAQYLARRRNAFAHAKQRCAPHRRYRNLTLTPERRWNARTRAQAATPAAATEIANAAGSHSAGKKAASNSSTAIATPPESSSVWER